MLYIHVHVHIFSRVLMLCRSYYLAVIILFTLYLTSHHLTSQTSVMKLNMPYPIQHGMSGSILLTAAPILIEPVSLPNQEVWSRKQSHGFLHLWSSQVLSCSWHHTVFYCWNSVLIYPSRMDKTTKKITSSTSGCHRLFTPFQCLI